MMYIIWYSYNNKTKCYRNYFDSYEAAENYLKYFLTKRFHQSVYEDFSLECGIFPTKITFFNATRARANSFL